MSLKTTPKGLLAALAALCIILLQLPAMFGGSASAARVATPRAAAPAHHAGATRAGVRPHTIVPGSSERATFTNDTSATNTVSLSPIAGPIGTPITVTGVITPNTPVSVTITGPKGEFATLGVFTPISPSTAFTVTGIVPITFSYPGTANVVASVILTRTLAPTQTATLPFAIHQPALSIAPAPTCRCVTATLTLTDFAPGVPITPTLVFRNTAGVTQTAPLTTGTVASVTPISDGSAAEGNISTTIQITSGIAYASTGVISVAASYPITPASYPTFTTATTPTVSVSPAPSVNFGPLGPNFTSGMTNTLNVFGSGAFAPNTGITFSIGLSGTAGAAIAPTSPVTSDGTGTFTGTIPFSPAVAGTYVFTAADLTGCNVATTTLTVVPPAAPGPPVATTYFAEGYVALGSANGKATFKTTYDLLNPNVSTVLVTNTYLIEVGNSSDVTPTTTPPDVVVVTHTLAPLADISIDAATDIASRPVVSGTDVGKLLPPGGEKFATMIQTAGFQATGAATGLGGQVRGVAAERIIERTNNSGARLDGDVSLGTTSANTSYYFAEGYTGYQFQEYLLLFNPSPTVTATVTVVRVPEGAATSQPPLIDGIVLAPLQRVTLNVRRLNALSPERSIGLIVNSADNPIVAERTEYFGPGDGSAKSGETIASGLTTAAKQLIFAYGSLTGISDTAATFVPSSDVAQTIDDRPFIEVINPNIAAQVVAGTVAGSAVAPGPAAHVTIQLRDETGRLLGFFFTDVDAGARFTLTYNDLTASTGGIPFPAVVTAQDATGAPTAYRAGVFSAVVSSSERVVAEEAQYFGQGSVTPSGDANSGAPGLVLDGAPTGETDVLFPALSETDPASSLPLSQTVFLYNPGVDTIRVNGTYFGPSGVLAHGVYTIEPDHIAVIGNNISTNGLALAGTAAVTTTFGQPAATSAITIPMGTTGAEFSTIQLRGGAVSGEPAQAPESFVAAAVTHSADGSNWWGTQGLYPLPTSCSAPLSGSEPAPTGTSGGGAPLPGGCP